MDITSIPFVQTAGIKKTADGKLMLAYEEPAYNHIKTIHAAAQFTLAESASGDTLIKLFPDLIEYVVPLLRESKIKYKKPANGDLFATSTVDQEDVNRFRELFEKKGRAMIDIKVSLENADGVVASVSEFNWFIQKV